MARPPRPKGIKRKPRHKKPKPPQPFEALRNLTNAPAETKHFQRQFQEMFKSHNHRGAGILIATYVENALTNAIISRLRITASQKRIVFGANGMLGSFSSKIQLGYSLEIFGDETFNNLEGIRAIRNAFAHSRRSISFRNKEVADVCGLLVLPVDVTHFQFVPQGKKPRDRFNDVCFITAKNLNDVRGHALSPAVMKLSPTNWETYSISLNKRFPIRARHELILRRQSLP